MLHYTVGSFMIKDPWPLIMAYDLCKIKSFSGITEPKCNCLLAIVNIY